MTTSEDEAILNYVRVDPTGARTLAVDKNNNLWVGGYGNFVHQAVDGVNGLLMSTSRFPLSGNGNHPGYCGLVDGYGYLWSVSSQVPWPYDSSLLFQTSTGAYTPITTADHDYGIAIDPRDQKVWTTGRYDSEIARFSRIGLYEDADPHGFSQAQGLVVDNSYNAWVAHVLNTGFTVGHVRIAAPDWGWAGNVYLSMLYWYEPGPGQAIAGPPGPTGLAVDARGKVWVANYNANNVMRINAQAGPTSPLGTRIGEVDMTVDLGDGWGHPSPYDYPASPYAMSDMTGFVTLGSTFNSGMWVVVQDCGFSGRRWSRVDWESIEPSGTGVTVEVRAADDVCQLPGTSGARPFSTVGNGVDFSHLNVTGRYLEVRVVLWRDPLVTATPALENIKIRFPE